jgi:hypothetical protein
MIVTKQGINFFVQTELRYHHSYVGWLSSPRIIGGRVTSVETKDVPTEYKECYVVNIISGHIGPHCVVLCGKVKYISLFNTAWKHRSQVHVWRYPFLTSALDGGKWSKSRPGCFTRWKRSRYPVLRRLCEPDGRSGQMWRRENLLPPPGFEPLIFQPIESFNYDYAIPSHCRWVVYLYAIWKWIFKIVTFQSALKCHAWRSV